MDFYEWIIILVHYAIVEWIIFDAFCYSGVGYFLMHFAMVEWIIILLHYATVEWIIICCIML
jgi:hypothetical protein